MRIERVDHVGVAVRDKEKAEWFLLNALNARKITEEQWEYKGQEFTWAYFDIGDQGRIELISSPDPDSFINEFIDKHGEGMHHITFKVEDFEEAVEHLRSQGIEVLDVDTDHPFWKEAFIRPRDAFGVLMQIAEFDDDYWGT